MKDLIKQGIITLVMLVFLGYMGRLWSQGAVIVNPAFTQYNIVAYGVLISFFVYIGVTFGAYPTDMPMMKRTLFVFGVMLILLGYVYLINDPLKVIYLSDLIRVLGVVLVILSPTGVLITDKIKDKKQAKKTQIIEV